MTAIIRFMQGLFKMPVYAQLWVMLLMAANMVVPLFYLSRFEAQLVLIVFMLSAMLMFVITGLTGFSRLLGAGHFLWFPLLLFLLTRLEQIPATEAYGIWIRILMIMNGISLIIDVTDVVRYVLGDKEEMVEGL